MLSYLLHAIQHCLIEHQPAKNTCPSVSWSHVRAVLALQLASADFFLLISVLMLMVSVLSQCQRTEFAHHREQNVSATTDCFSLRRQPHLHGA